MEDLLNRGIEILSNRLYDTNATLDTLYDLVYHLYLKSLLLIPIVILLVIITILLYKIYKKG